MATKSTTKAKDKAAKRQRTRKQAKEGTRESKHYGGLRDGRRRNQDKAINALDSQGFKSGAKEARAGRTKERRLDREQNATGRQALSIKKRDKRKDK